MKRNDNKAKKSKKITNKTNNNITDKSSNNKNVGFVAEDRSFEVDHNNDHSFEIKDCK